MGEVAHQLPIDAHGLQHPGLAVDADALVDLAELQQQRAEIALEHDGHAVDGQRFATDPVQRHVLALLTERVVAGLGEQAVDDAAVAELPGERCPLDHALRQLEELLGRLVEEGGLPLVVEQHDGAGEQVEAGQARSRLAAPVRTLRHAGGRSHRRGAVRTLSREARSSRA